MPLVQTRGAASAQGFGEFAQAAAAVNYIEDVFSTYLYTGNGSTQTITNGIDLAGKGGLVWIKNRNVAGRSHRLIDTVRGGANYLESNNTDAQGNYAGNITAFNSTGFSIGDASFLNGSGGSQVSWTFREQPKFFDVVTYTGTGSNTTIAHSLGVVPGSIIVKRTDTAAAWAVYHRSLANTQYLVLNTTAAAATGATWWNSTTPTSAVFSVGTDASVNASGGTYIAYIFAHDAGGFGLTGTDNVISCGSYTTNASAVGSVTLGYEPQLVIAKRSTGVGEWYLVDNMRGFGMTQAPTLRPNSSGIEDVTGFGGVFYPTATGFRDDGAIATSSTIIYIAIRRGPMKVPTVGTSVFSPVTVTGNDVNDRQISSGFVTDLVIGNRRTGAYGANGAFVDRLRGPTPILYSYATDAEATGNVGVTSFAVQDGMLVGGATAYSFNYSGQTYVNWMFRRAPSFFDEVCYTNPASLPVDQTHSHNLGVVPTLVITKGRNQTGGWLVLLDSSILGSVKYLYLDTTDAAAPGITYTATTTQYTTSFLGNYNETQVAYLFATCPGVSKVGSYTGTGTTLQINCGFTAGARFVLIKRTDSTGDWYVWDSARGIVAGNDPYLLMNSLAVEVTGTDYVDTYSAGFEISSTAPAAINASAGTFIFLAIA
jgi:hypothetical protein